MPTDSPKPRRRRWPWYTAAAVLLVAGVAGAWWIASQRVWTDGGDLRVPAFGAHLREVLWSEPVSPGPQFDIPDQVYEPAVSPDGQELYFVRGMPETPESPKAGTRRIERSHIYVSYRKDNAWTKPARLTAIDPPADAYDDLSPRLSADGKTLYFSSDRPGGFGGYDIWASVRREGGWDKPFNLGPSVNSQFNEYDPDPSPDGKHLIFTTNRTAAAAAQNDVWHATIRQSDAADYDLWIADRAAISEPGSVTPVFPATQPTESKTGVADPGSDKAIPLSFANAHSIDALNTPYVEGASCMSPSGDFIYFTSNRPGGFGKFDLYRSRIIEGVFGPPENLGPSINSADNDTDPAIAADGYRLYFSSDRPTLASDGSGTVGRYHLLSADSREVFPTEQARPLPHFGWSIWGVLGCGVAAVLLILLLRGSDNRRLNLLQKCLVVSILVHVLFTFSLSFVALTQQVTHYVTHDMGTPVKFTMPSELAEKIAVRSQSDMIPVPPAPPKNLAQTAQVQIPTEVLTAPPPNVQVTIPDARPRPGAVQIAFAQPNPKPIAPVPAPVQAIAPTVPPIAPTPLADLPTPPLPKPLHTDEAQPNLAPAALAAQQQIPHPTDAPTPPPIDLGQPNLAKTSPPPAASLPPVIDHVAAVPAPSAPDPGTPAPPPALPAPQVALTPTVARVQAHQQPTIDDIASAADSATLHQQPNGQADSRTAHSAGPANVPLDAPPIKSSLVANSPATIAMVEHNAGRPDTSGASALPGVAATQPAQIADAPPADLPSGLHSDIGRPMPTTEPSIATAIDASSLSHLGPTAVAAPAVTPNTGTLVATVAAPQAPAAAASSPLAGDPAVGWQHGDKAAMGAGQPAMPAPAPAVAANFGQAPSVTIAPVAADKPVQTADPSAVAAGPVAVASAHIAADVSLPTPSPSVPDVGNIAPPTGPKDVPGTGQAGTQGQGLVTMAPISRPDVSAPAVLPQVNLQPLTGLSGPSSPFARSIQERHVLLKKNGGNRQSEDAVDRGLAYLASSQQSDGRWTRIADDAPPAGRPAQMHDMACTGLSLLAFLARDQTPDKPCEYRDTVSKAAEYLLSQQGSDGDMIGPAAFRGGGADHANMYDHGIASFALGELALMTHDPRYTAAALKAAEFTVSAENPQTGGWRYIPGEQGDSSVFGWQIMSLHTAEELGFAIPQSTRDGAAKFIKSVSQGQFGMLASYQGNGAPTPPMTAEILFCRMWLGQKLSEPDMTEATGFLSQQKPNAGNPDLYYWYYASLCMLQIHHRSHSVAWKDWNTQTRDTLIAMQQKGGYWDTSVRWGDRGGRAFTTAIATLTLEVYYRYLPIQPTTKPG